MSVSSASSAALDASSCATPPDRPAPRATASEWDYVIASGRGTVYSYVNFYHPQVPPFEKPNPIALIETEEGTRFISNLVDVDPDAIEIGMPVEVVFTAVDDELTLPLFKPSKA